MCCVTAKLSMNSFKTRLRLCARQLANGIFKPSRAEATFLNALSPPSHMAFSRLIPDVLKISLIASDCLSAVKPDI